MKPTLQQPLLRVLDALCSSTNSPRSLGIYLRAKYQVFEGSDGLFAQRTDPGDYLDSWSYSKDNACTELLRKCRVDGIVSPRSRRTASIRSFWDSEHACCRTNDKFRRLRDNHSLSVLDIRMIEVLDRAKMWLSDLLGPLPTSLEGSFGPGATYGDKGSLTTVPDKITSRLELTREATILLPFVERTAWYRSLVSRQPLGGPHKFVRGNRFTTVPKTALKDRGICVEPSVNVFLQKPVGRAIKRRIFRKFGYDLNFGQQRHQSLAQLASRTGSHATIDLEAASDTVSLEVVRYLLPPQWFDLLYTLRSGFTNIDGKTVKLEKFSSMGNGYTFELETIIFASLAYACGAGQYGSDFLVFGDDIIVKTEIATNLLLVLGYCGFVPNKDKTYLTGPFRESCGGDFFNGTPVRAHNVEEEPTKPSDWISLANGLRRLGLRDPGCDFRDSYPFTAWMRCLDAIPSDIRRLRGPDSFGDLVINDDRNYQLRVRHGIRYLKVFRPIGRFLPAHHWKSSVIFAAALYGMRQPSSGPVRVSEKGVAGYKVGWSSYP